MTEIWNNCAIFYETPSDVVIQSRKIFYSLQKVKKEPLLEWLRRIKTCIDACDFGTLADFLLIDKFICELNYDEIQELKFIGTLSLDRLFEVLEQQTIYIEKEDETLTDQSTDVKEILGIELQIDNDDVSIDAIIDNRESSQGILETKHEITKTEYDFDEKPPEHKKSTKKTSKKPILAKRPEDVKGFVVDAENRFHCLDCGKKFVRKHSYVAHSRLHTGKNTVSCMICNRVFLKPNQLKHHFKRHERERSDCNSFECHLCRYKFLAVHGLRLHMNLKHITGMKNAFQCTHCNDAFVNQLELDNHLRTTHQLKVSYKCPHCIKEFDEHSDMKEHVTVHSEAKPFMCEMCGNVFKTKKQLHLHMASHTDERRFKCNQCGQSLKSRANYKNHMRQHTGERPFKCEQCEKTFVQRANYIKHLRWHTGYRPHACSYCDKRFPTAYDMKLHINSIHTGHKPFACEMCDRAFAQPSTLRVHRLRVHKQTTKVDNLNVV